MESLLSLVLYRQVQIDIELLVILLPLVLLSARCYSTDFLSFLQFSLFSFIFLLLESLLAFSLSPSLFSSTSFFSLRQRTGKSGSGDFLSSAFSGSIQERLAKRRYHRSVDNRYSQSLSLIGGEKVQRERQTRTLLRFLSFFSSFLIATHVVKVL